MSIGKTGIASFVRIISLSFGLAGSENARSLSPKVRQAYEEIIELKCGGGLALATDRLRSLMVRHPQYREALAWPLLDALRFLPDRERETRQLLAELAAAPLDDKPLTMLTMADAYRNLGDHG